MILRTNRFRHNVSTILYFIHFVWISFVWSIHMNNGIGFFYLHFTSNKQINETSKSFSNCSCNNKFDALWSVVGIKLVYMSRHFVCENLNSANFVSEYDFTHHIHLNYFCLHAINSNRFCFKKILITHEVIILEGQQQQQKNKHKVKIVYSDVPIVK